MFKPLLLGKVTSLLGPGCKVIAQWFPRQMDTIMFSVYYISDSPSSPSSCLAPTVVTFNSFPPSVLRASDWRPETSNKAEDAVSRTEPTSFQAGDRERWGEQL